MIYADYNATTPICEPARNAIATALETWGNPNSSHRLGRDSLRLLDSARESVAAALEVSPHDIVFTSGGSEANTNALLGSYLARPAEFRLLTSQVEHSSVAGTTGLLKSLGVPVEYVKTGLEGMIDFADFEAKLSQFRPTLVSLMAANNETGVVFPTQRIYEACRKAGVLFHTDAVQAFGKIPASAWNMPDLISVSAHKIYGPKGVGALIVKSGIKLVSTHYGGSQEVKRRGGTQNVPGIAGFGAASQHLPSSEKLEEIRSLRDRFESKLKNSGLSLTITGENQERVPNTTNVRFHGVAAEVLLSAMDLDKVCISAGSACTSGSILASLVMTAMGLTEADAKEAVRISWGAYSTTDDVDRVAELVLSHVHRIQVRRTKSELVRPTSIEGI